jgi:hypothetical protein
MQVTGQNPKKKYNYWAGQIAVPGLLKDDRPLSRGCAPTQQTDQDADRSVSIRYRTRQHCFNHISGSCWLKQ